MHLHLSILNAGSQSSAAAEETAEGKADSVPEAELANRRYFPSSILGSIICP